MALKVRDVSELENELIALGHGLVGPTDTLLRDAAEWYDSEGWKLGILDRQTLAHMAECIRSPQDDETRSLAIGALLAIQRDGSRDPERARFLARFAVRRLCEITGRVIQWGGIEIPASEQQKAQGLFDEARSDSSFSDADLVARASIFVEQHAGSGDMFGRFARDLETLLDVFTDGAESEEAREVTRAALVYFAEVYDAIPDDLGPVGLLDDAFVARRAVERLRPGRSVLAGYLDEVTRKWPFLVDMILSADGHEHRVSEFMVLNAAMLLESVESEEEGPWGTAIVTGEAGPLPFMIGFVKALSEIRRYSENSSIPVFEVGQRLASRETKAEVEFQGYFRQAGGMGFEECDPGSATHFRVKKRGRRGGGDVTETKLIDNLVSLQLSTRDAGALKRGAAPLSRESAPLGPLEKTFGLVEPVMVPAKPKRVVVVSPIQETRELARTLELHGVPIANCLPMGQAGRTTEDLQYTPWTKDGPGGSHLLTVVRTSEDALEIAEEDPDGISAVVAAVRPGSTDAAHLGRMASDDIPVIAIVADRDLEAQEAFAKHAFRFWSWDEEWLSHLHWPKRSRRSESHPIHSYEQRYEAQSTASVRTESLELEALDSAYVSLRALERYAREREDEELETICAQGFGAMLGLCRHCTASTEGEDLGLAEIRDRIELRAQWWPDEVADTARAVSTALESAAESLRSHNPKYEALVRWLGKNPSGSIAANQRVRAQAITCSELVGGDWLAAPGRARPHGPLVVTGWLDKSTMERILIPPAAPNVTLLLYGPEQEWYASLRKRRNRSRDRVRRLVDQRSPIRIPKGVEKAGAAPERAPQEDFFVDTVLDRARRVQVLGRLGRAESGEEVAAQLVYFAGGHWAPFGSNHRVNTVTHLMGSAREVDAKNAEGLRELAISELRQGDMVVLVRGSNHDAIRHAADKELPHGARKDAGEWRDALRRYIRQHSLRELRRSLARHGCKRAQSTIDGWISDSLTIGPKGYFTGTIEAIQKATEDEQLLTNLKRCKEAIQLVRSTHFRVANDLAQTVLANAREWLDAETPPEELVEVDERLVLLTVDGVDPEAVMVARSSLNRLREA